MDPWYKIATLRKEVREGRSFDPSEFAIHMEQVVAGTAPDDYRNPKLFFDRTYFTRALRDHTGMVLRRLVGQTTNTAPVLTLITQFGGGKTHTLTALYHLAKAGAKGKAFCGIGELLNEAGVTDNPAAKVAVFVGNAWDPQEGRETPWIDIAWQLAGEKGVQQLGAAARKTPPGTEALGKVFQAANGPVLLLFDEVLNFLNRHRDMSEGFYAFLQNLTVATTAMTHGVAVISLPRSQVEMTDWDIKWQDKITKVVRRVAKDLIANDETEISEVVRRRLFENIGSERVRRNISKAFADWCFERRAQLPAEWTKVDTTQKETKAKEYLSQRFESCYPFHPATLSVFQRKWQALSQYQQTRGTLAMLAQWISIASQESFRKARTEPLITLGSAPLDVPEFRSVVLGQLGESRLVAAIDSDIACEQSHARALDADTKGPLKDIHRRIGTVILFESSGGQTDKVAHLPELRFALGEPNLDTTSIDNAAFALERKSYYLRRVGSDGFRISYKPTVRKVVNDRRASLDEDTEIKPAMRSFIKKEFERGASVPIVFFPADGTAVQDTPKLTLVVLEPEFEWTGEGSLREQIEEWTRQRGKSPRLYPASLVWCLKKPGRKLREAVELWLAWKRVSQEVAEGTLGGEFERSDRSEIQSQVTDAEEAAKDDVWGDYRFVIIADSQAPNGLKTIDLGAGHSSSGETLCGRVITALKSEELLNESPGISYIERHWPPAFKESGAWPLTGLRQSFLNGSLTRVLDPDSYLRRVIPEFVARGDCGLVSGQRTDGTFDRLWFNDPVSPDEITFEPGMFLLRKSKAKSIKILPEPGPEPEPTPGSEPEPAPGPGEKPHPGPAAGAETRTFRITGDIPPEVWNRLGTRILPKLRSGSDLRIGVEFSVTVEGRIVGSFKEDLKQVIEDLSLTEKLNVEEVDLSSDS